LRQTVDLTTFGPVGELVVAASRLGQADRADAVQRQLDQIIDRRNPAVPAGWRAALGWHHIQLAVVTDDAVAAGTAAVELETLPTPEGERPATFARAVTAAARCWADLLLESVDIDAIGAAVDLLNDALLPWDAARLAGQAALRVTDPSAARSLLERARTLKTPLPDPDVTRAVDSPLSEREQEVATFLVDGLTYKEIGAQLYISAKTVEHHVARIRQKLGAGSRAELLAALRDFV
ncbi:MAG: helix-turn-helix transcriptional regulator, partial [Acidimicrobiales bacterium]|nr:helix-turn-helix transcriptional regulator [Acidimicrobiales bacterium]